MDNVTMEIALIGLGIVANGFFSGGEIALVSARTSRLAELRRQRVRGAAAALRLKEAPDAFLATIQIAITTVGTLASAVGGATAVEALTPRLAGAGAGAWAQPLALALVIVGITYVSLVVGELTPKAIALRDPERLACRVAPAIEWLSRAAAVVVRVLTASTNAVVFVLGQRGSQQSPFVSEKDVRYLVREGTAKGIFEKVEEQLVHNAFEFSDTKVRQVMTPRPSVKALDISLTGGALLREIAAVGHARVPVFRGSADQIVGVIGLKDVLGAVAAGQPVTAQALMREPMFVPETARLSSLLREFQRTRQHVAIVVNEHGGVEGLVTADDVLAEIVGELREGPGGEPGGIVQMREGAMMVDGATRLDDLRRRLGVALEDPGEHATAAGFVIGALGAIPSPGATVVREGYRFTVLRMDGPRVASIKVEAQG